MSHAAVNSTKPRAMIHKKILDVASEQPDASLDDIAAQVSSANTDLVERVLDKYGDPADTSPPDDTADTPSPEDEDPATPDAPALPSMSEITEKQRQTLQAIYDHPDASQQEIADLLDVTAPTVSRRVNTIEDFDWSDRHPIATAILDSTLGPDSDTPGDQHTKTTPNSDADTPASQDTDTPTGTDPEPPCETDTDTPPDQDTDTPSMSQNVATGEPLEALADRITELERQLGTSTDTSIEGPFGGDTELLHKVIHACMESETITQDEELQIIEQLLQ